MDYNYNNYAAAPMNMNGVYNPYFNPGFNYAPQKPLQFTNPVSQEKINEYLKNGKGLPKFTITEEGYIKGICTHLNPATSENMTYPLNDGSGKVRCKCCGAEFVPIDDVSKEDIVKCAENMWNVLQTCKMMWCDAPIEVTRHIFQILPIIEMVPKVFEIASSTFERYGGNNNIAQQAGQYNTGMLMNQIFGGAPMMGNPYGAYQQPMMQQPQMMGQPMMQQPQMMGQPMMQQPPMMNPMAQQMVAAAPGMSNGFGYMQQPMMGQQPGFQMNLDPNAQMAQAQAAQVTPQPAPAPANNGGARVTETLKV